MTKRLGKPFVDTLAVDAGVDEIWRDTPGIREEFRNDKAAFAAYVRASASGLINDNMADLVERYPEIKARSAELLAGRAGA